jgi:hypothetical protein
MNMAISFAQMSQEILDYFETVLKRGADDSLKTLIKAVITKESNNNLSAESIARVIKESYTELGKNEDINSKAVVKAAEILTGKNQFELYQQKDFKKDVAKALKNYALINTILKNLPNKATGVLKNDGSKFDDFEPDLDNKTFNEGQFYFDVTTGPCGARPFADESWGTPRNNVICLEQFHKIAYTLLQDVNCGRDQLDCYEIKKSCYYAIADRLYDLYNRGNVEQMMIDLKAAYPVVLDGIKEIEIKIPEQELIECLRAKKKQIEEGLEKLLKANDLLNETDLDAMKYNNEILEKIVDTIEEKAKIELINNNQKKEIEDWLVYAKKQMEEKDKEIGLLKTELEKIKLTCNTEKSTEIESTVQQYHHEDL